MTRSNGWKLKPEKIKLEIRYKFLTGRVINLWNSLPGNAMDSPWFDLFKSRMRVFLRNTPSSSSSQGARYRLLLPLCDPCCTRGQTIASKEIRICESEPKHDPLIPSLAFKLNPDLNSPPFIPFAPRTEGIF